MGGHRPVRVSDVIARDIRAQITSRQLRPGTRLPAEREMAQRLKTSRVSVREAYRSLEHTGLIEVRRGADGGAFITDVDHQPMSRSLSLMLHLGRTTHEELTEARLLVEPAAARMAARRASDKEIETIRELVDKQDATTQAGDDPRLYDLQFHRLIAGSAENLPLMLMINSMVDLVVEAVRPFDVQRAGRMKTVGFHRRIMEAIARRDEAEAEAIMREHIVEVHDRLGRSLALHLSPEGDPDRR